LRRRLVDAGIRFLKFSPFAIIDPRFACQHCLGDAGGLSFGVDPPATQIKEHFTKQQQFVLSHKEKM
jgi:hypothetical protein